MSGNQRKGVAIGDGAKAEAGGVAIGKGAYAKAGEVVIAGGISVRGSTIEMPCPKCGQPQRLDNQTGQFKHSNGKIC